MKNKIIAGVFAFMLAAFASLLIFGSGTESVDGENREAAKIPEFTAENALSGAFSRGFESFVDDNIGFRSVLTSLSELLSSKKGISTPAGRLVYADSDIGTEETRKSKFLIVNNSVFELFHKNRALEDDYADAVNHYAENLDPNIKMYFALIPTSIEFQEPIYANTQDSQTESIDYIESRLDDRVTAVDVGAAMSAHSGEYVYFRTDHHWTQLGAYYGYRAFCDAAGLTPVDNNAFVRNEIPDFLGSLYKQTSASELADKPDTIEWYDTSDGVDIFMRSYSDGAVRDYKSPIFNDEFSDSYRFFLSGDHAFVCLTNKNNPDGKTLAVVRDSFTNTFATWVIRNYSRVILFDPRSCEADFGDILAEFSPDEVLIMTYIFATDFKDYSAILKEHYMPR